MLEDAFARFGFEGVKESKRARKYSMLAVDDEYGEEEDGEHVQRQALASSL